MTRRTPTAVLAVLLLLGCEQSALVVPAAPATSAPASVFEATAAASITSAAVSASDPAPAFGDTIELSVEVEGAWDRITYAWATTGAGTFTNTDSSVATYVVAAADVGETLVFGAIVAAFGTGDAAEAGTAAARAPTTTAAVPALELPWEMPEGAVFDWGTVWLTPDIITQDDPTALDSLRYTGRGARWFFDPRTDPRAWREDLNTYLFDAHFGDHVMEVQAHPAYGSAEAAEAMAAYYAAVIGRLPQGIRSGGSEIEIAPLEDGGYAGGAPCGGIFHAAWPPARGPAPYDEEVAFHEGGHVSLDDCNWPEEGTLRRHSRSPGWLAAQEADSLFISPYARDWPNREDLAETVLPWFAVRCVPERVDRFYRYAVERYIPHRLAYLDSRLDTAPFECSSSRP
ncbi:MAG: hypothetical protein OXR82_19890 [Gammaproteobacteria bacterium]|nr:hypothetical protein [Gammaproteobacteria bacterium]MDE0260635.1 hypothetical protein [Gammaproteobacteria bacterium]